MSQANRLSVQAREVSEGRYVGSSDIKVTPNIAGGRLASVDEKRAAMIAGDVVVKSGRQLETEAVQLAAPPLALRTTMK